MTQVTRDEIEAASLRIAPYVRRTPVVDLGGALGDFELWLKLEHLQVTGSFKPRGAVSVLTDVEIPAAGVTAASGGNFGAAVAYAAARLGVTATVFVPETSPGAKISRISSYGAVVEVIPGFYDDALERCKAYALFSGAFMAHAYDQQQVAAGQGTLALELSQQIDQYDTVLVAVGGGGLIAGIASWARNDVRVVAVEPEKCPGLHDALAAGRPVESPVGGIAASSLGARTIGDYAWAARQWIDRAMLVSDDDIVGAQRWLWSEARQAVEPAAAATVAALRSGVYTPEVGERVVAVLSGGNVDPSTVV